MSFLEYRLKTVPSGFAKVLYLNWALILVLTAVAGGMMPVEVGAGVVIGANVGTTLIVQALSFDMAALAPVLILVGMLMFRRGSNAWAHDLGIATIGYSRFCCAQE